MSIRPEQEKASSWPEWSAFFFCLLLGTAHILSVHPIGDGLWFWYARQFREGSRLYADLHLSLQPFFVLLNAAFQKVLGVSWIASKAVAFTQLVLFAIALVLLSRYVRLRAWQRAVLIVMVFLMTITVAYARFDDYHITTHCFVVYSVYVLLRYREGKRFWSETLVAVVLGALAGLSIVNRLNDGASLSFASLIALPFFARRHRLQSLLIYIATAAFCVLLVVKITGDTVSTWAAESIFHAAAIKGGTGPILLQPLLLPLRLFVLDNRPFNRINAMILAATFFGMYAAWARRRGLNGWRLVVLIVGILLLLTRIPLFIESTARGRIDISVGVLGILLAYLLAIFVVWDVASHAFKQGLDAINPLPLLLLFPFGQLMDAAMSSGRFAPEYTPAIGIMLLLLPIAYPWFAHGLPGVGFVTFSALLAVGGLPSKILHPYYWHHYDSAQMFVNREWYRHPVYGPMLIDRGQEQMMTSFCRIIHEGPADPQLLAMPYPYPNYFCDVEPWHGYVQTWYDTSGVATITHLKDELKADPPHWIMYQRGLDTIYAHERGFNNKLPLPHRGLDDLILQKLLSRQWAVVKQECFSGADWILIRTTPASPAENDYPVVSTDHLNLCKRTENNYLTAFY